MARIDTYTDNPTYTQNPSSRPLHPLWIKQKTPLPVDDSIHDDLEAEFAEELSH